MTTFLQERRFFTAVLIISIWLSKSGTAWSVPSPDVIAQIGKRWDEITYHWPKEQRGAGLTELLEDIQSLRQLNPQQPELLIWEAITLVTRAGADPGLGVLSDLERARKLLLQSIRIDPDAMDGAAYLTLACLYYKAPGWPLSFGDMEKAAKYFQSALALNPNGIESNYYYASFLSKSGDTRKALAFYQKTTSLPPNPEQPYLSLRLKEKAQEKLARLVARSQFQLPFTHQSPR